MIGALRRSRVLLLGALLGCAWGAALTEAAARDDGASCGSTAPSVIPHNPWRPAMRHLAPHGALTIRLCRYSGFNAHPPQSLVRSRLITSSKLVGMLVRDYDRLPSDHGAVACPNEDGSQIDALVSYPAGRLVMVQLQLTGCNEVTNGDLHRIAAGIGYPRAYGPQLVHELKRLTR